jgi:hypothetical protein
VKVQVRFVVEFQVMEGDPLSLAEPEQFALCEELMARTAQTEVQLVGADPLMDDPKLVLEPIGWTVDSNLWGDLAVGSLAGPVRQSARSAAPAEQPSPANSGKEQADG